MEPLDQGFLLMEHVRPLKDMLDWLAGDPPVIESYSTTWGNVAGELGEVAVDYRAAVASGTAGWGVRRRRT
ncbi:hypothetical protein ABZ816_34000 [Actinosynnema sp. NPDC047251]|uniref:hypothetical protein n=1 Tax=Saccharothrix espanaensis TaxID=103731 RepID=UPI00030D641F|nr:hypothetical protein [Saccharothrix espanaensis]